MTFSQVAKILGMTVHDIERNVRAERIPVVRVCPHNEVVGSSASAACGCLAGRKRRIPDAWVFDPHGWMRGDYAK